MIAGTGGQREDVLGRPGDRRHPRGIRETDDGVRVGDIEMVTNKSHAEWGVEVGGEHRAFIGNAVRVGVTQQCDPVGAWHCASCLLLIPLEEPAADAGVVVRAWRRVGLGDQHITVWQHVDPAWVIQIFRKSRHRCPSGPHRHGALGPSDRLDHIDRGNHG